MPGVCLQHYVSASSRSNWLHLMARRSRARGGKITGAGGGGFLLLYCEPNWQAEVRKPLTGDDPIIDSDDSVGSRWIFVSTAARR